MYKLYFMQSVCNNQNTDMKTAKFKSVFRLDFWGFAGLGGLDFRLGYVKKLVLPQWIAGIFT